ncbi:30S ribosome-binding factor RbfA [Anaerococcus vaginalis]|uniref:30S ribosome-binding factor RbfA n=1 Tax=Anaerococcus vaginalis TaxID=33037 RepID=UPI0029091123|nr:30S ribosome-binding factor RbfA [Anaerococcus vaginalis]MDU5461022.1 30S ribosome-binding factor RbfA [Anaerococcus vaginalis]
MDKRRTLKISSQMQKELSKILAEDINDPRLSDNVIVSITEVEVTNDLSYADIFVSVLGDENKKESVIEALDQAKGYMKKLIGEREFRFKYDNSIEHGVYMDKLIAETIKRDEKNAKNRED